MTGTSLLPLSTKRPTLCCHLTLNFKAWPQSQGPAGTVGSVQCVFAAGMMLADEIVYWDQDKASGMSEEKKAAWQGRLKERLGLADGEAASV